MKTKYHTSKRKKNLRGPAILLGGAILVAYGYANMGSYGQNVTGHILSKECAPCPQVDELVCECDCTTLSDEPGKYKGICPVPVCPPSPDCAKIFQRTQCENLDVLMDRIINDDSQRENFVKKILEREPSTIINHLSEKTRSKLGSEYVKGQIRQGYKSLSDKIKGFLDKGRTMMED